MAKYFGIDTEMYFGKHKGLTVLEIAQEDPGYLIWMYENFEDAEWSSEVEGIITMAIDDAAEERRLELSEDDRHQW